MRPCRHGLSLQPADIVLSAQVIGTVDCQKHGTSKSVNKIF